MRTEKELAQEALNVQDACNLLAVINGMSRASKDLRELYKDWSVADKHPIIQLWVDKLAHLSGYPQGHGDAYEKVFKIIEEKGEQNAKEK